MPLLERSQVQALPLRLQQQQPSCKRGPADAGGIGVVNWPRRHRREAACAEPAKLRFARIIVAVLAEDTAA